MNNKILHVAGYSTFMPSFLNLLQNYFNQKNHTLIVNPSPNKIELPKPITVVEYEYSLTGQIQYSLKLINEMHKAEKVIIHGLFDLKSILVLFSMPWLLKKCHWVIWGGDLYIYQLGKRSIFWHIQEFIRRPVIENMGHLVTYIPGDVDLARKWYGAKGDYHECLMYLSNTYNSLDIPSAKTDTINIQIGNSADPSNNHIQILEKLLPFKDENIKIYAPLSYGDKLQAEEVIVKGKELFGDKFIALTDFMPLEEYLQFLGNIDIAIFNHKRQQAMGNTITLLGLGKTVFVRSDTTQWQFFKDRSIKVYDSTKLDSLHKNEHLNNIKKVKEYFSKENLIKQYSEIF